MVELEDAQVRHGQGKDFVGVHVVGKQVQFFHVGHLLDQMVRQLAGRVAVVILLLVAIGMDDRLTELEDADIA